MINLRKLKTPKCYLLDISYFETFTNFSFKCQNDRFTFRLNLYNFKSIALIHSCGFFLKLKNIKKHTHKKEPIKE